MPLGDFVEPGTTPRPLSVGRLVRLAFGLGLGFIFSLILSAYPAAVGREFADIHLGYRIGVAIGVAGAFWSLPDLVTVGFSRTWGRWPQAAVAGAGATLVVVDLVAYGSWWGPPFGWAVFLFIQFFLGFAALSFLFAALFAVPG